MTTRIHVTWPLVLSLMLAGCGADATSMGQSPTSGLCESHGDCPPTQVCSNGGTCEVTCLTSSVCASNATLSGALTVETLLADGLGAVSIRAEASFIPTEDLSDPSVAAVPGTECRLLPRSQMELPPGLSVGPITISCAKEEAEASDAAILNPTDPQDSGIVYGAEISEQLPLNANHPIHIEAAGNRTGDFSVGIVTPPALEDISFEIHDTNTEFSARTIRWAPGFSSQIVLTVEPFREPTAENESDLMLVCPARDEAGSIHLPGNALAALEADDIVIALTRRNLTQTTSGTDGFPIAAEWTYRWKENLRTTSKSHTANRSE